MKNYIYIPILIAFAILDYASISGGQSLTDKTQPADSVIMGENSYYINCNESGNVKVTIVPIPEMTMGIYDPSQNATLCGVGGYDGKSISLGFVGNETGTFTKKFMCEIKTDKTYKAIKLKLKVNKYEEVGGLIEGTFNGIFVSDIDVSADTCKVTNGKFSVIRQKDFIF